jgi:hypothetical protein
VAERMPDTKVRALTLKNPWAHAMVHWGKRVENRNWAPKGGTVGRLLIHAGRGWDDLAGPWLGSYGHRAQRSEVVTSAIVAVTSVVSVCDRTVGPDNRPCGCGMWAANGQFHWRLGDVRVLEEPIPVRKGRLGLWIPVDEILTAVDDELARSAS